ncbi:MAG: PaaI family thioesterase [Gammaproteobacteria bacterium]|nr:PaaI family thioesterase [Gammaproteobacteria bacterium]
METLQDHMLNIPHARAIGMSLVSHDAAGCVVRVPYAAHLVGDPDTGVVHGGVLTALLDNACGMAVRPAGNTDEPVAMATLDLRIDYMGAAQPHRDILAQAVCFKRTRHIAFVRATAYQTTPEEPIATCVASFMLGTPNTVGATSGSRSGDRSNTKEGG